MATGPLIVIMTDFGTENWYDAVMKGEILRRASDANILDLSHEVPRQSIEQGAFMLHCAIDSFPKQTIFCCVIDPGVGGVRRGLVGWVGEYGFVGPDNGLVTPLLDRAGDHFYLSEIKSATFRNVNVSSTFHGRDLFAPAAGRLWLGDDPRMAGPRVTDPVRLPPLAARREGNLIAGKTMLVDKFGNVITNIEQSAFQETLAKEKFRLNVKSLEVSKVDATYENKKPGEALAYWGSSGFLEVAVNFGSAADHFGIEAGDKAVITLNV